MTAQNFYELNKGKHFMYNGEKVRVVGFCPETIASLPIMVAYKKGCWAFPYPLSQISYEWRESLINDGDMGEWVNIEALNPIEPQEIDLCEILKGCEGVELWSDIFGKCKLESSDGGNNYEIEVLVLDTISGDNGYEQFTKYGRLYYCYPNGKCMLWPSETNRDWPTFKKPIKEGVPCMCKNSDSDIWVLRTERQASYTYCVPVDNFDFKDIESNISRSIV